MIASPLRLAGALVAGTLAQAPHPTVESVAVEVRIEEGAADVVSRYHYLPGSEPLELNALRVDGQAVELDRAGWSSGDAGSPPTDRAPTLERLPGLYRLRVAPGRREPGTGPGALETLTIRYRVTGDLRRIPLFVPTAPIEAERDGVEIRVTGLPARAAAVVFPRMRESEGGLTATLANMPTFLLLSPPGRRISFGRAADGVVLTIILLASAWWVRAQRRRRFRATG